MQRGFMHIATNGDTIVGDKMYPAAQHADAIAAAAAAAAKEAEDMQRFDDEVEDLIRGGSTFATVAERFTVHQRREHGKVNSYNAIIAYCIRSNMDIKVSCCVASTFSLKFLCAPRDHPVLFAHPLQLCGTMNFKCCMPQ